VIFVVRHARAGNRGEWEHPDDERPLSDRGMIQAKAIAERLAAVGATMVVSSPYLRCVQTVQPLADLLGVPVETAVELAEGHSGDVALDLIRSAPDGAVLCSHGDVLQDLVWLLAAAGAPVDPRIPFRKGAVLTLERLGNTITAARYDDPPA